MISKKRLERAGKINSFLHNHKNDLEKITNETKNIIKNAKAIEQLTELMSKKEISAKNVMLFFCQSAIEAQNKSNCLTEVMFEEALKKAKIQDKFLAEEGKLIGPFHGIPFSIKDTFNIEGLGSDTFILRKLSCIFLFHRFYYWIRKKLREASSRNCCACEAYL
jgi:hypothetical protein